MSMHQRVPRALACLFPLCLLAACGSSKPAGVDDPGDPGGGGNGATVHADFHTLKTPPLEPGEFDLLTLSTLPDTVTGGDVLVGVRGLDADDALTVRRNGQDVSEVFARGDDGMWTGLVDGLVDGSNNISAIADGPAGRRSTTLRVVNHPVTGPVLSGPHQQPFHCQSEDVGLGAALDADCTFEPRYQWFARQLSQGWEELENPFDGYPPGTLSTQTFDGRIVPYVVRVETRAVNRGIGRIAVLDDPAARAPDDPFEPAQWNGNVYYVYGESCGLGYRQGRSSPETVLGGFPDLTEISDDNLLIMLVGVSNRLGSGDITVHNTLSAFGNHCNPLISIETTMMMKEHIVEQYGPINRIIGTNGSGAALQQYNAANNAPGLLSAGLPIASFADIPSTAMTVADCGLLVEYYQRSELDWSAQKQWTVNGHNVLTGTPLNAICDSWVGTFLDRLVPDAGSGCGATSEERYHPEDNPTGVRCTVQDANVNIFGTEPHPVHGAPVARRPLDNTGVQYGLQAFNDGVISFEEFLDLNRNIGGYDIDGRWQPERMAMHPEVEALIYRIGGVIGRGALAETPIIDLGTYLDLIPVANIHEAVRPFTVRARLRPRAGGGITQSIFRGVLSQPDVFPLIDRWLDDIQEAEHGSGFGTSVERVQRVIEAKPLAANDRCSFGTLGGRLDLPGTLTGPLGIELPLLPTLGSILGLEGVIELLPDDAGLTLRVDVPENFDTGLGPCAIALPVTATPRMVAGMPLSDDIIKCQLKAVDPEDYAADLGAEQLTQIEEIFPDGVCDFTRPAAGDVERSDVWVSIGGRQRLPEPVPLRWRAARGKP